MQLSAVILARTIAFLDIADLNPRNRVSFIDFSRALAQQYKFVKSPQALEQLDLQKGVEFLSGKLDEINIERFTIFLHGIAVDTRSSTDDSDIVLQNALEWTADLVGLDSQARIYSRAYVSQLTFYSDLMRLPLTNPAFQGLATTIAESVSKGTGQPIRYELSSINIGPEPQLSTYNPGPFTIERRQDVPFSENKYYSTAPLPTRQHISLLETFETQHLAHQ